VHIRNDLDPIRLRAHQRHPDAVVPESLVRLPARVSSSFGTELPERYVRFLQQMNQLDFNGTLFFASQPMADVEVFVLGVLVFDSVSPESLLSALT
jgi:hypothetical protein